MARLAATITRQARRVAAFSAETAMMLSNYARGRYGKLVAKKMLQLHKDIVQRREGQTMCEEYKRKVRYGTLPYVPFRERELYELLVDLVAQENASVDELTRWLSTARDKAMVKTDMARMRLNEARRVFALDYVSTTVPPQTVATLTTAWERARASEAELIEDSVLNRRELKPVFLPFLDAD